MLTYSSRELPVDQQKNQLEAPYPYDISGLFLWIKINVLTYSDSQ